MRMFREYFCARPSRQAASAWLGLGAFLAHALYKAWLKFALNQWYGTFYDSLQTPIPEDVGSGASTEWLADKRAEVWELLWQFALLVAPMTLIMPISSWISRAWRFSWRVALVRAYLAHYDTSLEAIEGAAQRVHEDTQRFEEGVHRCVTVTLDAVLSLGVFVPVLIAVGAEAHLPGWKWPPWLLLVAFGASAGGLVVSVIVARPLVDLEVANQRVEARFRTRLVVLEHGQLPADDTDTKVGVGRAFVDDIFALTQNYYRLFARFARFDAWIGFFDQAMILAPYFLVAPLLFAEEEADRITLGALMRVTNAFKEVFGALSTITERWADINEFRSTMRRLSEFERHLYGRCAFRPQMLSDDPAFTSVELAPPVQRQSPAEGEVPVPAIAR